VVEISTIVHITADVGAVHAAVAMLPIQMEMGSTRSLTTENVVVGDALWPYCGGRDREGGRRSAGRRDGC